MREGGGIAERGGRDVAEHADVLVAHHQAPQHLHAAQHHHVVDASDQARGLCDADELLGGDQLVALVAQARHRLVEPHLALRQRHHRLQEYVDAVLVDRIAQRRQQLGLVASIGGLNRVGGLSLNRGHRPWRRCGKRRRGDRLLLQGGSQIDLCLWLGPRDRGGSRGVAGQQILMGRHGGGELPDQSAQFVDLADDRLDAVGVGRIGRGDAALDGGKPAAELGHLASEVGGAPRQVGDLAADVAAVAHPHRHRVVEDQEGQRGQRHDGRFRSSDAGDRIEHEPERGRDQDHANGDEDRRNANHAARSPQELTASPGKTRVAFEPVAPHAPPSVQDPNIIC